MLTDTGWKESHSVQSQWAGESGDWNTYSIYSPTLNPTAWDADHKSLYITDRAVGTLKTYLLQ
ncbi:hypothetical protein LZF95_23250 [Algoriphagus sp. AGSA1]|uniref:hypothetical protein n=1 Tax=Algoriphagus sp. AGSA1 TaxID=2907213 RepID=UPI001F24ABE2|nr:hypothetical protein [Algoriphagus sp. AGSA1]MCE7057618.1 hypothetical protein [Algoriphagus sp. AGSA1]